MDIDILREYCLSMPHSAESFPFGKDTLVFKVFDKMFALCDMEKSPLKVNLKSEPEKALQLREKHHQITLGFHMNKNHWNTLEILGISDKLVKDLILESYKLVANKLPKKIKLQISKGNE